MKKPTNDREKAVLILNRATGDATGICAAAVDKLSDVERTCLAHAYDNSSPNFAHEVINYAATRERMEQIAAEQLAKEVSELQSDEETLLNPDE